MASDVTIEASYSGFLYRKDSVYLTAQQATTATGGLGVTGGIRVGQYYSLALPPPYMVARSFFVFDLSSISGSDITAVKLRLYGDNDYSDTEFNIIVVSSIVESPMSYSDFDDFGDVEYGTYASTSYSAVWNEVTLNAAGIAAVIAMGNTVLLGIRSDRDIAATAPTQDEFIDFKKQSGSYPPELVVTVSDWPLNVYPNDPEFPAIGKIDFPTLSVFQSYIESLTAAVGGVVDGDGNIDFQDTSLGILWDGTSESITYDSANNRVDFTTLSTSSGVTITGDFYATDLQVTAAATIAGGVPSAVTGDAEFSDTAYASEQAGITDNELWHTAVDGTDDPGVDEALVYQLSTDGDLIIEIDIGAGVKTGKLVDFSLI